jgi:hypothetical protein
LPAFTSVSVSTPVSVPRSGRSTASITSARPVLYNKLREIDLSARLLSRSPHPIPASDRHDAMGAQTELPPFMDCCVAVDR